MPFFLASFKIIMSIFSSISKFYAIFNDPLQQIILFNDLFQKEYVIFFDQFQIFGPKF